MTVEKRSNRVLFNGQETSYKALEKVLRWYFDAEGWARLWQDVGKHGRVHVAVIFVENKGKGD